MAFFFFESFLANKSFFLSSFFPPFFFLLFTSCGFFFDLFLGCLEVFVVEFFVQSNVGDVDFGRGCDDISLIYSSNGNSVGFEGTVNEEEPGFELLEEDYSRSSEASCKKDQNSSGSDGSPEVCRSMFVFPAGQSMGNILLRIVTGRLLIDHPFRVSSILPECFLLWLHRYVFLGGSFPSLCLLFEPSVASLEGSRAREFIDAWNDKRVLRWASGHPLL